MKTDLINQIRRVTSEGVNDEFERFFRSIGYTVGLEGQRATRELWHEICDDDGLVCQVKTGTPLAEFLADLPHLVEGRPGVGPTDYWCTAEDDEKLRELLARAEARLKEGDNVKKSSAVKSYPPHPMQPVIKDGDGVIRFRENAILGYLFDHDKIDMNQLAKLDFPQEDREQFAQLLGYQISHYREPSYVSNESAVQASALANVVVPDAGGCRDGGCPIHGGPLFDDAGKRTP